MIRDNEPVKLTLDVRIGPAHRPRASDVGSVLLVVRRRIAKHQITVSQQLIIRVVVAVPGVVPADDDCTVARIPSAPFK